MPRFDAGHGKGVSSHEAPFLTHLVREWAGPHYNVLTVWKISGRK